MYYYDQKINDIYQIETKPQWWIAERYDYCDDMKAFKVERTPILKKIINKIKGLQ